MPHDPDNKDHWCSEECEILSKLKGPPAEEPFEFDLKTVLANLSFRKKNGTKP